MTVVKFKEIFLPCSSNFSGKSKIKYFSKYINIKMEMNLCSGKTAKLKDLFPIVRDYGLNAQL